MFDTVLRGGFVLDGSGGPAFRADVGVSEGRIAAVDPDGRDRADARREVDVAGLVVAPGFIDMHAHSDLQILANPEHRPKVTQGVTLEVLGQDGLSYAPIDDDVLPQLRQVIAGWNDDPADFDWSWRSVGEYLDRLDQGIAVNAAYLVPQGTLRMMHLGWDDRPATDRELDAQRTSLDAALGQGALGMSSGLTYPPGMYAPTDELVALCEVVARRGGYYSPHHRSYGMGALDAYAEMIDVSRRSGCPVHLTHATMNFPVNHGRAGELLALLDDAISDGVDVTLDSYPYAAACTTLSSLLPSWSTRGGAEAVLALLRDPAGRERIRVSIEETGSDGSHGVPVDWDTVVVAGARNPSLAPYVGRSIAAITAEGGRKAYDVYADILLEDELGTTCVLEVGDEDNVQTIMRHPAHMVGSDGILVGARPHPRAWGTFPRYLGHYARELGVLALPEAVAKMTSRPARRLGLADRGRVEPGCVADLVAFDADQVADRATYADPKQPAAGLPYVMVNGTFVIDDGRHTGALPGRSVRAGAA
jgi:N-acyl-D-amino-acid deacylase